MAVGAVAEVKSRLAVADVVGETVQLRKAGTTYKGLCPFHAEKTPSFVVTPARETWKCFGCQKGGDIFSFVMERDGIGFPEALRVLAARAGVELDERSRRDDVRKARLRQVMESAYEFYHVVLRSSKHGQPALEYLRGRGFTDETIDRFGLGWAPDGWDEMSRRLVEKRGIVPEELVEVGLAKPRQRGGGVIDSLRGRITFPIRDQNGHATGIGGRLLAGDGPKYLNSPATALFDKSRTLYLIDKAKGPIRKGNQAVIVEGYTDALMAHQAGFDNVVASLGTALTPGQVALVVRYAKRIALAYDVDEAGERAGTFGVRALEALIGQLAHSPDGVELDDVRVVTLPDGKDPDEVLRDTPDLWREQVRTAAPIADHLIATASRAHDLRTPGGKSRFVDALLPTLRVLDPVRRDSYLQEVQRLSGVEQATLLEALHRRGPAPAVDQRMTAAAVLEAPDALRVERILASIRREERDLLRILLEVPEQQLRVADELGPDQLPSTPARELFRAIVLQRAPSDAGVRPPFSLSTLMDTLDEETAALARALLADDRPDLRELSGERIAYAVDRCLLRLERSRLDERAEWVAAELLDAEGRGDRDSILKLVDLQRQNHEARRAIDRQIEQATVLGHA
ncbi:MAG TPA: DNA primase [Candidatus Limnocylindrales bacterium]